MQGMSGNYEKRGSGKTMFKVQNNLYDKWCLFRMLLVGGGEDPRLADRPLVRMLAVAARPVFSSIVGYLAEFLASQSLAAPFLEDFQTPQFWVVVVLDFRPQDPYPPSRDSSVYWRACVGGFWIVLFVGSRSNALCGALGAGGPLLAGRISLQRLGIDLPVTRPVGFEPQTSCICRARVGGCGLLLDHPFEGSAPPLVKILIYLSWVKLTTQQYFTTLYLIM